MTIVGCLRRTFAGVSALAIALALTSPAVAQSPRGQLAASRALNGPQVGQIVAQAVNESRARGAAATIAVVDRVGNVLAVYQMNGSPSPMLVTTGTGIVNSGLEGVNVVPTVMGAIAKAVTGAYLSSLGNAFTTRTASQIVQDHFNPLELFQPGGPLYGVQFSNLPCSDLNTRFTTNAAGPSGLVNATIGPKRSPLGLSADSGGLPLYIDGVPVGGVGVIADGTYSTDADPYNEDRDIDELIAVAATAGFQAPIGIRANRITAGGRSLRFTDVDLEHLAAVPAAAPPFAQIAGGGVGRLVDVAGYYTAARGLLDGAPINTPASGIRPDSGASFSNPDAHILVDGNNIPRFAPRDGTNGPAALSAADVREILEQALNVALTGRAQIRQPLNSPIEVTISVSDANGVPLGTVRTPDGPVFGIDVSLQKARTAAFFSSPLAATELNAVNDVVIPPGGVPVVGNLDTNNPTLTRVLSLRQYLANMRAFLGPNALTGANAFTARAVGLLGRPYFPDGIQSQGPGPIATGQPNWSPFAVGLQLDYVILDLVSHILFVATGGGAADTPARCGSGIGFPLAGVAGSNRVANGFQPFAGGSPIYRGGTLIGAVGVSGDGIDQDDMIGFLGVFRAGQIRNTGFGHAPPDMRADQLTPQGIRLRYVSCPFQPFVGQPNTNACQDK